MLSKVFARPTFFRWRLVNSFLVRSVSCLYFFLNPFNSDLSLFSYSLFILKSRSEKSSVVRRLSWPSCSSSICSTKVNICIIVKHISVSWFLLKICSNLDLKAEVLFCCVKLSTELICRGLFSSQVLTCILITVFRRLFRMF